MRRLALVYAFVTATLPFTGLAQQSTGPYKVLMTAKVGGEGGFDYVYADSSARGCMFRAWVPRDTSACSISIR